MSEHEERRLPPSPMANAQRLQARDYDSDWARIPSRETDGEEAPGAGPRGSIANSGRRLGMRLLFAGFAVLIVTFFMAEAVALFTLLGGLALLVGAVAVFATAERFHGNMHGVGTLKPKHVRKVQDS